MRHSTHQESQIQTPGLCSRLAWLPIPLLVAAIVVLKALDWQTAYESEILLMLFNFAFSTLASLLVVVLLGRSFLARGTPGMLLFGCGVLLWGAAGTVAPALLAHGINVTISVHNILVCLSAFCQLAGAILSLKPRTAFREAGPPLWVAQVAALGVVWLVTVLALGNRLPLFFVQGEGGTPLRYVVLASATVMFAGAAALLWTINRRAPKQFVRWYGPGLLLVATGLFGIMIESVHGGALSWTGRAAQFLGGAYMLMAALASVRESGEWKVTLSEALEHAREAARASEVRYRTLFDAMTEGFALHEIITDDSGRPCDYRFLEVNPAFERLTGLKRIDLIGKRVLDVMPDTESNWIDNYGKVAVTGEPLHMENYSAALKRWYEVYVYRTEQDRFAAVFSDITNRRQSEEALREREADLIEAQRLAHLGSWYWDAKTDVTTGSHELLGIYGFDPATHTMPNFKEQRGRCYSVEDWEQVNAAVQRSLETGAGYELDVRVIRNGAAIWVTTRGEAARDANGQIVGLRGTVQDITERKQAEESLRRTEEQLRRAQEIAHLGSWDLDLIENRLTWSDEVYRIFGLQPQEFSATYDAFLERVHPDDRAKVDEAYSESLRENRDTYEIEHRIVRKDDGEIRIVHERCQHFRDANGKIVRSGGMVHDITARKQAEEVLRQQSEAALNLSEQEFHSLAEAMPQIVWATRPDGWNIYFNQQWVDYTGMTMEESYGHGWNTPFHPDDKQRAWDAWQRATQQSERYSLECRLRRADGVYRWWLIRGEPMRGANGEILKWFGTCTDIEELKRAETLLHETNALLEQRVAERTAALRESEALYRSIGESIDYGVWVCAADGRNTYASKSFLNMVGITQEQCSNFGWGDLLHPDDAERTIAAWQECVRTGGKWDIEHRFRGVDGQWRHILARGVPVRNEQGEIISWAGINLDISRLKQAEESLRETRDYLENLLNYANAPIIVWDSSFRITRFNHAFERLTGLNADEVISKPLDILFPDNSRDESIKLIENTLSGERWEIVEISILNTDGSVRTVLWNSANILDENNSKVVATIAQGQDITMRKRAEEARHESEARFRTLADNIPPLCWMADADGWIFWYSKRWYEYTGTTPDQMEGWGWQSVHDPEILPQVMEQWKDSITTGNPFDMIFPLRGSDGIFRPFLTRVMPVSDNDGKVIRWFGTNIDISERMRFEDELQRAHDELAKQVEERTRELAEKEVLLKEVHHRVKNNLQVISSLVSLQADGSKDETVREVLKDVTYRVRSMALVHEKLYQSADLAHIDFAEYARSLLSYLWRAHGAAAANIRLKLDLEPVLLPVDTGVPCGLILNELGGNALKHAFQGRSEGEVTVTLENSVNGRIRLSVSDNGVGLQPGFDWRQASSLGLHLVKLLSKQLGASVEVSGEGGTRFEIIISSPA